MLRGTLAEVIAGAEAQGHSPIKQRYVQKNRGDMIMVEFDCIHEGCQCLIHIPFMGDLAHGHRADEPCPAKRNASVG